LQRLVCRPSVVHQLSLVAGVATVEAIGAAAATPIAGLRLKWPNDVLIGEAKCAGILPESQMGAGVSEAVVVIGIGINLAAHPTELGRAATHLAAHGLKLSPEAMLGFLAGAVERWIAAWDRGGGFARVRAAWLGYAGTVGESLSVRTGREHITGTFLGLDEMGALLMRDVQGQTRRLTFGDVTLADAAPRDRG
jgi:BirA family biotin operon repressor/biotin-[acetyl-CoA-carboxylase] ligase